jgi:methionyl-tRNA formyltransferase
MHKFLWCLNTEKGFDVLNSLIKTDINYIGGVCSYPEWNVQKNFGNLIEQQCHERGIPYIPWNVFKNDYQNIIKRFGITGIITIGWQFLLPTELNNLLPDNIIIFHDSVLPLYRGFCPTSTAILKGDDHIGMSIIYASEEMDKGDIILQKSIGITDGTYIEDAIKIQSRLYCESALELMDIIESNQIHREKQNEALATYCIWRNPEDNEIDWNSSSKNIYNLIRATGYPYYGAYTVLNNEIIRIWESVPLEGDVKFEVREPGKIWKIENGSPVVICKQGLLKILKATYEDGRDLLPLTKFRLRFGRAK